MSWKETVKSILVIIICLLIQYGLIGQCQWKQLQLENKIKTSAGYNVDYFNFSLIPSIYKYLPDSINSAKNIYLEGLYQNSNQKGLVNRSRSDSMQNKYIQHNLLSEQYDNWPRIYHDEINAPNLNMLISYDHGYLLMGRINPNYPRYNWLIKTDINGEILWEKMLGDGYNVIVTNGIGINDEGSIYLSGGYGLVGAYSNPFVMKLNACGEKEWCKVIFAEYEIHKFSSTLTVTPDGGCVTLLNLMGDNGWYDRNCLTRFDKEGNMLCKQCYNSLDSLLGNELCNDLILTPDNGFLLTGYCYYTDTVHELGWPHPYYIKTDSLGNFEWETVPDKYGENGDGQGWTTVISPDSNYYYSSISHYYRNNTAAPALVKMDMSGNVVGIYDIAEPDFFGILYDAKFISDTTLVASVAWGPEWSGWPKAVIIDTLGKLLGEKSMLENDYLARTELTIDNKYLFYTQDIDENEEFDAYLFKLNQNLESDTVYTQYFTYDSLCDGEIVSDTIALNDCGIIVGNVELYKPKEESRLLIYPNPAGERIIVACPLFENENCKLEIIDQQGRKITAAKVMKGESEIIIDATGWPPGFYVVRVISNAEVLSGKVVVRK